MRETLLRMPERCDPYIYYSRVRPYIHGWKNSPSLPQGVVYEGVADYARATATVPRGNRLAKFDCAGAGCRPWNSSCGRSADAVSRGDAGLYASAPPDVSGGARSTRWMSSIARCSTAMRAIAKRRILNLWKAFCTCVDLLAQFRDIHIGYAERYIFRNTSRTPAIPPLSAPAARPSCHI